MAADVLDARRGREPADRLEPGDEWMTLVGTGVAMPMVEIADPLTEDELVAAHARLRAGGLQGKLAPSAG